MVQAGADQGHAGAQTNLGAMYAKGQGVVQNYKEASKWFKLAAEQGFALSKCFLAEMYINGHGIKKEILLWQRKWQKRV